MYWPQIGRFISADSVMGSTASPMTLNRYSYVLNNPYKYTDPTGHEVLLVGSKEFKSAINDRLAKIEKTPTGGKLVKQLKETKHLIKIIEQAGKHSTAPQGSGYNTPGVGADSNILFDPALQTPAMTAEGPKATPSEIILGHELSHAANIDKGVADPAPNPKTGIVKEEEAAVKTENKIRQEIVPPQPQRVGY
jgi:hypothetical protein